MVKSLMNLSEFEEMYLKTMFEIHSQNPAAIVKTSMLAESMGVSAASTTEMIQRLSGRDLVTYIPYKGSRLTSEGFAIALPPSLRAESPRPHRSALSVPEATDAETPSKARMQWVPTSIVRIWKQFSRRCPHVGRSMKIVFS